MREMNGSVKFVYRKPCGCVMAEAALKEMRRSIENKGSPAEKEEEKGGELSNELVCPVDGESSAQPEEWFVLNPQGEELRAITDKWEAKKVKEKEDKKKAKAAKRKGGDAEGADGEEAPMKKKKKADGAVAKNAAPAVKAGSSVPKLQATLAAKLAEQKKQQSAAVASLYAKPSDNEMKVRLSPSSLPVSLLALSTDAFSSSNRTATVAPTG